MKMEMKDGVQYAVIEKPDRSYTFKYMGDIKKEDDVVENNVSAREATRMCTEHNESTFREGHGIEKTLDDSGMTDHHGRQVP